MNNFNEAIKLAIEKGGYANGNFKIPLQKVEQDLMLNRVNITDAVGHWDWINKNDLAMSPVFWQALGKACGWPDEHSNVSANDWREQGQQGRAHQYFDLILTGGNQEKFWEELLNTK